MASSINALERQSLCLIRIAALLSASLARVCDDRSAFRISSTSVLELPSPPPPFRQSTNPMLDMRSRSIFLSEPLKTLEGGGRSQFCISLIHCLEQFFACVCGSVDELKLMQLAFELGVILV
ncbi:uncharacterized protein G2W53_009309 [Senna tora]|uniref:Secreted protein n=1 Tax=Senna tora TaxID=362788 RepID=A0A835C9R7_9FABA|nr:uncharacterized protein G2W53_009309 [Senna tora]